MTDLHDKARNLLALREKATPGPWLMRWKSNSLHKAPPPNTPYTYGDFVITVGSDDHDGEKTEDVDFIAAAHDMADIIAALLAENERLTAALKSANTQAERFEREWYLRGDALEAAEARLRALCEQEPVAWLYQHPVLGDNVQMEDQKPYGIWSQKALIPRPSMEGKP